jgi:hypothetical protein
MGLLTEIIAQFITTGVIIIQVLYELHQIRARIRIGRIMYEAILQ